MTIAIKVGYCGPSRGGSGSRRQFEGIDSVVSGVVNAAASDNTGVPFPRAGHHFIGSAAGVNHSASVPIECVQTSVASTTGYPYNHVIRAVRRGNKNRTQSALTHAPGRHHSGRICRSNFISCNGVVFCMKNKIRSLTRVVRGSRLTSDSTGKVRRGYRQRDTAEIIAVKQVGHAIFAQREHQLRRRGPWHIDKCGADAADVSVALIE